MKTKTFELEFLKPNSGNPNFVYNENLMKIDSLMDGSFTDFATEVPMKIKTGDKFLITEGEHKGKMCYQSHPQKPPTLLEVKEGNVVFVQSARNFFSYSQGEWEPVIHATDHGESKTKENDVAISSNTLLTGNEQFLGIQGTYVAPADHEFLHLYVNDDVTMNLDNIKTRLVTFIIKQHYQSVKQFAWPRNPAIAFLPL